MVITQDDKIVFANKMIAEILGLSIEELSSSGVRDLIEFVHPDDRMAMASKMQDRINGQDVPNSNRFRILRKDGTIVYIESYGKLIQFKGKQALHLTYFDISSYQEILKSKPS